MTELNAFFLDNTLYRIDNVKFINFRLVYFLRNAGTELAKLILTDTELLNNEPKHKQT